MPVREHGLKRELRLWDLVPMQVMLILSLTWCGFAAKQGGSQLTLWLLAIVLFYLPLAAVVIRLSRALPQEGGVYQWVKAGISPFAGYMAAWNVTVTAVIFFSTAGSMLANGIAHVSGPSGAWTASSKPLAIVLSCLAFLVAFGVNVRGLHFAKWWSDLGAVGTAATAAVLGALLVRAFVTGLPAASKSLSLALPSFSIVTLNVFTKMALSALSGFDNCAIFSEECRKPENDVGRSVMVAAPLIALIYIVGTGGILAHIAPADVDLAAAVPQTIQAGFGSSSAGRLLSLSATGIFNFVIVAGLVVMVGMVARLPMVAGWDGLLPGWWSELHARFRTPVKALFAVTTSMLALGIMSLWGANNEEAAQVSAGAAIGSLCVMYMLLFASVLFGFRSGASRIGWGVRLGALAAFLVSLLALIFEAVPLGEVASPKLFAMKVGGVICATNAAGTFLYWRGIKRLARLAARADVVAT
jgi:glutamate:GABA antiporter